MLEFRIAERVRLDGEIFVIVGMSPVSVVPAVVHLESPETGELVEASMDEITPVCAEQTV